MVKESKSSLVAALQRIDENALREFADAIISAFKKGRKILIAGNGGSAADSQHFAAELVCTFENRARPGLPAISLTTNTSIITAWGNDFSYDTVFQRQVEALGEEGDILFSITTSGNSKNILAAMEAARKKKMINLLFSGKGGGEAVRLANRCIVIDSSQTPRIQECHIFCIHEICAMIDGVFSDEKQGPVH